MVDFTVLQSVYSKDKADYLNSCFDSILKNTYLPKEIILVKDGPINDELESVISYWKRKLPIRVVGYDENKGLAYALNYGLEYVNTEYVARMDSDDVCCIDRFEKQLTYLTSHPDIVLLSGYINEFDSDPTIIQTTRKIPLNHDEIKIYLKKRNAFNHMAVIFKKSAVIDSGSYQFVPYFEDYDLWIRMVQRGYKVANISDCLVNARIGNDMIGRRHGIAYAKHEVNFLRRQLVSGFISRQEYNKLLFLRVPVRLLPKSVLKIVYKILRG